MSITYFTNKYPSISHTFIRREILELVNNNITVHRLSLRRDPDTVDNADLEEYRRTTALLERSRLKTAFALIACCASRPRASLAGLYATIKISRTSNIKLLKSMAYFAEALLLLQHCQRHKTKLVRVHFGTNCAVVARICRRMGGPPYSVAYHGPDEFDRPTTWDIGGTIKESAFVTAITHYCSAQLKRWSDPDDWNKIHIIRCSVNSRFLSQSELPKNNRNICFVGRFSAQKGLPILIRAFTLAARSDRSIRLNLVGDGELLPMIKENVYANGIEDLVLFHGPLSENGVGDVIRNSSCLAMASFAEGLPVVLMEAMGLGRPVIATNIAGIPELVEHGVNGWLVPADDEESLASAIQSFAHTSYDKLCDMGDCAHRSASTLHDITTETTKLLKIIHKYTG